MLRAWWRGLHHIGICSATALKSFRVLTVIENSLRLYYFSRSRMKWGFPVQKIQSEMRKLYLWPLFHFTRLGWMCIRVCVVVERHTCLSGNVCLVALSVCVFVCVCVYLYFHVLYLDINLIVLYLVLRYGWVQKFAPP